MAFAKAHSLPKGWTLEKWQKVDFSDESSLLLNYITVSANIAGDLLEPAWIQDSPRKQSSLVAEKIMVWGYIQYGGCARDLQGGR